MDNRLDPVFVEKLLEVTGRYDYDLDEPATIEFLGHVGATGILSEQDKRQILEWLDQAMRFLGQRKSEGRSHVIDPDEDPRNADWLRTITAQRYAGHRMPLWACLWLWWLGHDRSRRSFWDRIGKVAESSGYPRFRE
jgi:hypothetical protein